MGTPNQPLPWPGHWLEHRFADALPGLCSPWQPQPCAAPRLLVGNHADYEGGAANVPNHARIIRTTLRGV